MCGCLAAGALAQQPLSKPIAGELVQQNKLTKFQVEAIFEGRLFMRYGYFGYAGLSIAACGAGALIGEAIGKRRHATGVQAGSRSGDAEMAVTGRRG